MQDYLNLTTHQSTKTAPYELHYGKSPTDKLKELFPRLRGADVLHGVRIQLANEKLRKSFEQRCRNQKSVSRVIIDVGDLVLLCVPHLSDASQKQILKFFHLYEDPFRFIRRCGSNAFEIADANDASKIR